MKFTPPEEPNGNISSYLVQIYHQGQLVMTISQLNITKKQNNTLTAVINGLKGGQNYSIRVSSKHIFHTHRNAQSYSLSLVTHLQMSTPLSTQ